MAKYDILFAMHKKEPRGKALTDSLSMPATAYGKGNRLLYIKRCTSNGEDVFPTLCCGIARGTQRQLDNSGSYILDYYVLAPIDSQSESMVEYLLSKDNKKGTK